MGKRTRQDGERGQSQARSGPASTPGPAEGSRSQKKNNSGRSVAEPSESPARAFLPSSSKFSAEAGRALKRGSGGARRRRARQVGQGADAGHPERPAGDWSFIPTRAPAAPTPAPAGLRVAGVGRRKPRS